MEVSVINCKSSVNPCHSNFLSVIQLLILLHEFYVCINSSLNCYTCCKNSCIVDVTIASLGEDVVLYLSYKAIKPVVKA